MNVAKESVGEDTKEFLPPLFVDFASRDVPSLTEVAALASRIPPFLAKSHAEKPKFRLSRNFCKGSGFEEYKKAKFVKVLSS